MGYWSQGHHEAMWYLNRNRKMHCCPKALFLYLPEDFLINIQIYNDQCEWFPLELCSVQLVPLSMATLEGACSGKVSSLALGNIESEKIIEEVTFKVPLSRMDWEWGTWVAQ